MPSPAPIPPPSPVPARSTHGALRAATAAAHGRLDARFADGLGERASYTSYLLGMHRFASDFEHALARTPRLSAWLACDLATLGVAPMPPAGDAPRVQGQCARIGWEYVMAGSSMGARQLLRGVRALGFDGGRGARFLDRHGASDDWAQVRARLGAYDPDNAREQALIAQGALAAFALADACFARSAAAPPAALEHPA